ncbi:heterokaryon incompatibility protein-domain-containing protein [Alternaria rosae]|uniref:heterokaryon incompatibility protein-domain-containing protein n=1 Tax=Alternaria rosae TaxID=1187941 RepID=UPI001E8DB5CA|nr:heterokaryon incompatibility protein-domain-containing protein [Alternaria rosae]KAH6868862.1 heterokaryon incompatibility protein-domain-containing protein [Alternaria rosae]
MDSSQWKDNFGHVSPHSCEHCKDIIFTFGELTSFSLKEVERADKAGCEFFRLTYQKYTATNITTVPSDPKLIISCVERGGGLDIRWVDGATPLFDSVEESTCPLSMFTLAGSPAFIDIETRPLNLNPGSEEQIRQIRHRFRRCRQEHKKCMELCKTQRQELPARLIEVGALDSKDIRVLETRSIDQVAYAILSYCWGGDQESKTIDARLERRRNGFPLDELPQTIKDAVFLTRKLRLKYLWVDAICIVQDNKKDIDKEIRKMDQIYRGALITFAAARATEVSEGFLGHREPTHCYGTVCQIQYRQSSGDPAIVRSSLVSAKPLHITYEDPIDLRAWTFQEHYQSLRTVRFGSKQTVWECPASRWVDGGINYTYEASSDRRFSGKIVDSPYPFRLDDASHKHDLDSALGDWQSKVEEYSGRKLKNPEDRLPAFAAIAKAFGAFLGLKPDQYLAGLWLFDLSMQLRWRRPDCELEKEWASAGSGPSWSWASLTGPVIFDHPRLSHGTNTLRIDDWKMEPKLEGFEYGEVLRGRLTVSGNLCMSIRQGLDFIGWHPCVLEPCLLPLVAHWDCQDEQPFEV